MVTAIIVAAGRGKRMNSDKNKVFMMLGNQPILLYSVLTFSACTVVDKIVVVAASDEVEYVEGLLENTAGVKNWQVVIGGSERQYSIANALKSVSEKTDLILVHDAARPLVSKECIRNVIQAAKEKKAVVAAVAVKDTIKIVDDCKNVIDTPDRNTLWAIQTPQGFDAKLLRNAYDKAEQDGYLGTDDASLVERMGVKVKIVVSSYDNIKITTPEDIIIAEALMKQDASSSGRQEGGKDMVRFGMGYDVHKLVEDRKLILGGVEIPYTLGLAGHSDADVLLHSIKDALLGAAALGDIGRHFPDTDMQYKGVSSILLLERVRDIVSEHGYIVNNIDATIVAQKPKLASYIPEMNKRIATALQVEVGQINVKATTTEGLGFVGQGEGIAAYAVASIVKNK